LASHGSPGLGRVDVDGHDVHVLALARDLLDLAAHGDLRVRVRNRQAMPMPMPMLSTPSKSSPCV
jgi:hypothetical protein